MFTDDNPLDPKYTYRRELVFLILAGIFLGSLTILNILGLSKMISFPVFGYNITIPIGVLPHPITFLCTDFISELYGKRRANLIVWIGLLLNVWVLFILWLGDTLPPHTTYYDVNGLLIIPPDSILNLNNLQLPEHLTSLDNLSIKDSLTALNHGILPSDVITANPKLEPLPGYQFHVIKGMTFASTIGSMIAYLLAQFIDVKIFHYLKDLTKGKHLWLRNNGSTMISQLVDSFAVILIAHYMADVFHLAGKPDYFKDLLSIILSIYIIKFFFATIDTIPFYYGTKILSKYLKINSFDDF